MHHKRIVCLFFFFLLAAWWWLVLSFWLGVVVVVFDSEIFFLVEMMTSKEWPWQRWAAAGRCGFDRWIRLIAAWQGPGPPKRDMKVHVNANKPTLEALTHCISKPGSIVPRVPQYEFSSSIAGPETN
jgi:hypothetical protein